MWANAASSRRYTFSILVVCVVIFVFNLQLNHLNKFYPHAIGENMAVVIPREKVLYATYSVNTPSGNSYRGYDYVFHLPLTALAWERIGFKSAVIVVGDRCQWENNPVLNFILKKLEERKAVVIFLAAHADNRNMLSQTARLFTANMDEFPGQPDDFIITSDTDLWPLRKEHYTPLVDKKIVMVHPNCCHVFEHKTEKYQMYAMSNIGATVSTWQQIMNEGHTVAKDAESILDYYEKEYAPYVRNPVYIGSPEWYLDQKMASIRLNQWMAKYGNDSVQWVSDEGFYRLDRIDWHPEEMNKEDFDVMFDAHMPLKFYLPERWNHLGTRALLYYMYGKKSPLTSWCDQYVEEFYAKVKNYVAFTNTTT